MRASHSLQRLSLLALAALLRVAVVQAEEISESSVTLQGPPQAESLIYSFSIPGWLTSVNGTAGINGVNADLDLSAYDILKHTHALAAIRGDVSYGRFGATGEFIYLSMDAVKSGTSQNGGNITYELNQIMADFGFHYRILQGEKGWLDAIAGVRYTNVDQGIRTETGTDVVGSTSADIARFVERRIEDDVVAGVEGIAGRLRESLQGLLEERFSKLTGRDTPIPIGPIQGRVALRLIDRLQDVVGRRDDRLIEEIRDRVDERNDRRDGREDRRDNREDRRDDRQDRREDRRMDRRERREQIERRIAKLRKEVRGKMESKLTSALNQSGSRADGWVDPYIGVRARYNFTPAIYGSFRGDVGGFSAGSQLSWEMEASVGMDLPNGWYTELGYRALYVDYNNDGLLYDTTTHGPQITLGYKF